MTLYSSRNMPPGLKVCIRNVNYYARKLLDAKCEDDVFISLVLVRENAQEAIRLMAAMR